MENNKKPNNPLVYPKNSYVLQQEDESYYQDEDSLGMTLRDYSANSAMQGILSGRFFTPNDVKSSVKLAYFIADEMLKQRKN